MPHEATGPPRPERPTSRVTVTTDGPVLLQGPVEVVLPDGTTARSERPVTALCVCGSSRRYPFCDTSHRRRVRGGQPGAATAPDPTSGAGAPVDPREEQP